MRRIKVPLTEEQRKALIWLRDHAQKPYLRERCSAILQVAEGKTIKEVAQQGLLRPRSPDTVADWVHRYLERGIRGLYIKPGRGRKPAYARAHGSAEAVKEQLEGLLRRSPTELGIQRSRWTLDTLRQVCWWLKGLSLAGVWKLLKRLKIRLKKGRLHVRCPDPERQRKMQRIVAALFAAEARPDKVVALFLDETSFYREPTLAATYHPQGASQPVVPHTPGANTRARIVATLDWMTGRLLYRLRSKIDVPQLIAFLQGLEPAYPEAEVIYVILDCWPVHFHPEVLAALQGSKIILLPLPTYSSWWNPIEKVWRKLRQERLHLHRYSQAWPTLKEWVAAFFDQFANGSEEILRYTGLKPELIC